ncbi:hypothetical protein M2418_002641 [Rhizobium sp. BIGb0125]|nr:hypothetical protein [Rhizobium sp. BIGb0125]
MARGATAHYDSIKAFSEADFTEDFAQVFGTYPPV